MQSAINNITRFFLLTLAFISGITAHAEYEGRSMENPVLIDVAPEKFTFVNELNPCDWGFSATSSSGKEMYYSVTIDEPMSLMVLNLGSQIRGTEISVIGDNGIVERSYSAEKYRQFLAENNLWDLATYDLGQDCFLTNQLNPGTYRIKVKGIRVSNANATNGPTITTVIGYNDDALSYIPLPAEYCLGTQLHPFYIGQFNTDFSTTIAKYRDDLSQGMPFLGKLFFRVVLDIPMTLSFDTDNKECVVSVYNNVLNQFTVIRDSGEEENSSIYFSDGDYLLSVLFPPSIENDLLSLNVNGQIMPSPVPTGPYPIYAPLTIGKNYIRTRTYLDADGTDYREETLYADGLGRQSQRILTAGSPDGSDIVWRYGYDTSGRASQEWLPGISQKGGYTYPADIDYSIYSGDSAPFTKNVYEASTLNRVVKKYGAGAEWHDSDVAIRYDHDISNSIGEYSCYVYTADATADSPSASVTVRCKGRYLAGELLVERVTDEDGRVSLVFTDGFGRKVLDRRVLEDGVYADTYYVYDLYDNLTAVLSPEASAAMAGVGVWTSSTSDVLRDYCYLYRYDSFRRIVSKRLPGCEEIENIYDDVDRLVLWRDGNLRAIGRWGFRITDIFGHEVLTGTCASFSDHPAAMNIYALRHTDVQLPVPDVPKPLPSLSICGYDVYGLELGDPEVLTVSYYDDYSFTDFDFVAGGDSLSFREGSRPVELYPSARGMLTGRLTAVPVSTSSDSLEYLASAYYYDYRGRTVQSVEANRLGGYDRTTTGYDYVGNPIFTELTHTTAADPTGIRQQWEREYDRQGRELTVRHRLGGGQWTTLSAKEYDPLGRLQSETAGITSTYSYDIRSRQTSVTSDRYNQWLDFTPGGNVSRMKWHTNVPGDVERSYAYSYDGLSRLTAADYYDATGKHGLYNTWYDYDLNGNVTSLTRRGITEVGVGVKKDGFIDRLTYEYQGNQVKRITDDAPELTYFNAFHFVDGADEDVEYAYDANGNTVSDLNRGIGRITYDVNNHPRSVSFNNGGLTHYIYDAQGRKLRTEHRVPSLQPTLPGVIGAEQPLEITTTDYCGQFIYEDGVLDRINLAGGYINLSGTATPEYHYFQRDHLGNNRTDLISGGKVCQVNHYYPYGMNMYIGPLTNIQRWKFGGKELDRVNGLDLYDFEARAYDPATIRMWRPDDLAHQYYSISPFAYCANNPLILTDPTGKLLVFAEGSTEEFKAKFQEAYQYLKDHGASEILDQIIEDPNYTVTLVEMKANASPKFKPGDNVIYWSPMVALAGVSESVYLLSPAELLNHEAAHALRYNIDKAGMIDDSNDLVDKYGNKEEERVIGTIEPDTAFKLDRLDKGKETRTSHFGNLFKVSDVKADWDDPILELLNIKE